MNFSLAGIHTIALIMSPRLGDSLLTMIVAYNLRRHNYKITIFSHHLYELQQWFPGYQIKSYPKEHAQGRAILIKFDLLLYAYPHDVLFESDQWHPNTIILDKTSLYRRLMNMVDLQVTICEQLFGLCPASRNNGLVPPKELKFRSKSQRIIIHPTAHLKERHWLPHRFIKLATKLTQQGYLPLFVISPVEKSLVPWLIKSQFSYYIPESLDKLAAVIYESGWFIGNDSGLGHLASNLGIPTITLMQRRKVMLRWRPGWANGEILLPWMPLLVRTWKEKYWKYFISVKAVLRAFQRLQKSEIL